MPLSPGDEHHASTVLCCTVLYCVAGAVAPARPLAMCRCDTTQLATASNAHRPRPHQRAHQQARTHARTPARHGIRAAASTKPQRVTPAGAQHYRPALRLSQGPAAAFLKHGAAQGRISVATYMHAATQKDFVRRRRQGRTRPSRAAPAVVACACVCVCVRGPACPAPSSSRHRGRRCDGRVGWGW